MDTPRRIPVDPDVDALSAAPHALRVRIRPVVAVAIGGCVGTFLRWVVGAAVGDAPLATLAVNIVGAFLLGALLEWLVISRPDVGGWRLLRLTVGTGLLGSFTTYSAFAVAVVDFWGDDPWRALGYAALTLALGSVAALLGVLTVSVVRR